MLGSLVVRDRRKCGVTSCPLDLKVVAAKVSNIDVPLTSAWEIWLLRDRTCTFQWSQTCFWYLLVVIRLFGKGLAASGRPGIWHGCISAPYLFPTSYAYIWYGFLFGCLEMIIACTSWHLDFLPCVITLLPVFILSSARIDVRRTCTFSFFPSSEPHVLTPFSPWKYFLIDFVFLWWKFNNWIVIA